MLNLLLLVGNRVTEDEAAPLGCVAVKICIDMQLAFAELVEDGKLGRVDGRVANWIWLRVHPVQVETLCVIAPVATLYAIWVQKWNDLEHKSLKEKLSLRSVLAKQVKHALEENRCACLTAVNT